MGNEEHVLKILDLANLLSEKQVDTTFVSQALDFICRQFGFDSGLVYEIDQYNVFHLKEAQGKQETPFRKSFEITVIPNEYRRYLAEESVVSIWKNDENSNGGQEFLTLFETSALYLVSVVDEKSRINGLIAFLHAEVTPVLSASELETLSVMLSMLGRYVSVRVYQNKLAFAQTSLESILDNTGIDIYVNDFHTHDILYVNQSMAAPYGGISEFTGHKCWEILFPGQSGPCEFCPQNKLIDKEGNPTKVYTWDYQRAFDGSWFRVFSAAFRWVDGRLAHVVSSADITDNKKNEELIQYMAHYDSLTNLPNRRMLINECERRINQKQNGGKEYLLFFDIDNFKGINDAYGHDSGDEFLIQLGKFFSGIPLLTDSIYRNGGDEFVAIIGGEVSKSHIRNLAHFIHERFQKPWILKKGDVFCNTSIGVAIYPEDGQTAEELLLKADQAMYQVKKSGGGGIRFSNEMED